MLGINLYSLNPQIEIFPYILEKSRIDFFVHSIEIGLSPNYDLDSVSLDGINLNIHSKNSGYYHFNVGKNGDEATKIIVNLKENGINTNSRYLTYSIKYSKKEISFFIFKEKHIID